MKVWRLAAAMLPLMLWSCSGDETKTEEPVQPEASSAEVPDAPGDAGETAEKPAGATDADASKVEGNEAQSAVTAKEVAPATEGEMEATTWVNVRTGPGMTHAVSRVLNKGAKVQVVSCDAVWCKIGGSEYVSKKFLQ